MAELHVFRDDRALLVSRRRLRGGRGRPVPHPWPGLTETAAGDVPRRSLSALVVGVPVVAGGIAAAFGAVEAGIAAGGLAVLAGPYLATTLRRRSADRARSARGRELTRPDVRALRSPAAFDRVLALADRISETWPELGTLITPAEASALLADALWEIAELLSRREDLTEALAALDDLPGGRAGAERGPQLRAPKPAAGRTGADAPAPPRTPPGAVVSGWVDAERALKSAGTRTDGEAMGGGSAGAEQEAQLRAPRPADSMTGTDREAGSGAVLSPTPAGDKTGEDEGPPGTVGEDRDARIGVAEPPSGKLGAERVAQVGAVEPPSGKVGSERAAQVGAVEPPSGKVGSERAAQVGAVEPTSGRVDPERAARVGGVEPTSSTVDAELAAQVRAVKTALSEIDIELARREANLRRAEEAGRAFRDEQRTRRAIRAAERSLQAGPPVAGPPEDAGRELAEHIQSVLSAYRELTAPPGHG